MFRRYLQQPRVRRGVLQRCQRQVSLAAKGPWSFEFRALTQHEARDGSFHDLLPDEVNEDVLQVEYDLPDRISTPQEAIGDFVQPIQEQIRSLPTARLGLCSGDAAPERRGLEDAARALTFFDDLKARAEALVEEQRVMEAVLLFTSRWQLQSGAQNDVLSLVARRNLRDCAPAYGVVAAALLGPLAWIPGVLTVNEVIMGRVDRYGALAVESPDRMEMAKAAVNFHVIRALYDWPRVLDIGACYEVREEVSVDELQESIANGEHGKFVTGKAEI